MQDNYSLAAAITLLFREESNESEHCAENKRFDDLDTTIDLERHFPTEVFYFGEEQCEIEAKYESPVLNENTQTQRIASPEIFTSKQPSRKQSEQNTDESCWVRRSTRRQSKESEVSVRVPKKDVEKAFKNLKNRGRTTVASQKTSWESIQRETWKWMKMISKKEKISRKQLESHFLICFEVIKKALTKNQPKSPGVHAQLMRFAVDFTKLFDVSYVCELKSVFGYLFRLFNDVLTKFTKNTSLMNETSTVWVQTKSVLSIIISTTIRTPVLHALIKAIAEIQLYFMTQISATNRTSTKYEFHVNYVLSQFAELNQTVVNRLIQLQNHQQLGITV